ncbi:hypothetical protein B296_00005720 [Ensete ventricosum]|uniref:Uncharacterized protein n=1 Tax=Ensete ventricosum TaxID=4639 RepID=A0A427B7F7_ENSVE|nr:hypothetical protein B296_00005720 [Ensete ventricosum]
MYSTTCCLLCFLVEHSCINPKSLAFGYLDKKLIDIGLMKFISLCPSVLSWYLEFVFAFSTSSAPFLRPMLSLHKNKGSMTPRKSRLCSTTVLPSPYPYYPLTCIRIPSFVIGRSAFAALWCSSESTAFLTDALLLALLVVALFTEVELPTAPDHSHDHVPLHGTHWKTSEERSGSAMSLDHGGDLAHIGNLTRVICRPMLRDDPNILVLEGGPMSQDRISNLFPSWVTEEAVPPTPTRVAMPHIATAPLPPQPWPADRGQSTLTPDRYWRLFTNPGLTPPGHTSQVVIAEAFLGLAHQVQALTGMIQAIIPYISQLAQTTAPLRPEPQRPPTNQERSREHPAPARPGPTEPNPPETWSETPLIVPEKSTTPHPGIEHASQDPNTLSSDSTNSF